MFADTVLIFIFYLRKKNPQISNCPSDVLSDVQTT